MIRPESRSEEKKDLSQLLKKAGDLGFLAVGFSLPQRPLYFDNLRQWVADHKYGDMSWLERRMELREQPERLLKGCRTIISLAYPYPSQKPVTEDGYTVARYSQPTEEDYHPRLKRRCRELLRTVEEICGDCRSRIFVDSAPLLEKSFACSSGIGFFGKNTLLIIPGYGSYFFLAEILTTAPINFAAAPRVENRCGSCTLCIDACPTRALEKPFYLDASRCLSYLTIEHKVPLDIVSGQKMGDCFFGCDRCQEVCPFNEGKRGKKVLLPSTEAFLTMGTADFEEKFGNTSLARAGLDKIQENIRALRATV
jgi:epoxyqueuosine reductase